MNDSYVNLEKTLPYPSKLRWGYQHYPVFGRKWWLGRSLVFGLGVLTISVMTGLGAAMEFESRSAALMMMLVSLIGFGGMTFTGVSLASIARTFIKPGTSQKSLVTASVLLGIIAAFLFDAWSSREIEASFLAHGKHTKTLIESSKGQSLNSSLLLVDFAISMLIYSWLAGGIAFVRYWREPGQMAAYNAQLELSSARADKHDAEARLNVLQAQIEPHFLFNSLASLKSVLRENPELAESTINDLVDYLRASIPKLDGNSRVEPVSLKQQIELCRKYLQVMKLRLGDRLEFETELAPEIEGFVLPPLIVISLVENAIKHGIEPSPSGGRIDISAFKDEDTLVIKVQDTGVGLSNPETAGLSSGIGLQNIRDQLLVLYGENACLELSGHLNAGVTAQITIELSD